MAKLFYSAVEVKQMQMDADLKARVTELDARQQLQRKDMDCNAMRMAMQADANATQLRLETKNAQDAAQSIVTNAKNVAELTEKLAVAQAQVAQYKEALIAHDNLLDGMKSQNAALLATVTELAKKPVIVEKLIQTSTASPAQMCVIQGDKAVPVQIVK